MFCFILFCHALGTFLQAFYMDKQYRRALTLLKGSDLIEQDVRFRYLAAKCLVECREWEECLMMVGGWEEDSLDSIDMQVWRQLYLHTSVSCLLICRRLLCTAINLQMCMCQSYICIRPDVSWLSCFTAARWIRTEHKPIISFCSTTGPARS